MKQIKGFTLIELVIVIVILGILAVAAAPKFLNMQDDARVSTLKGLEGAIRSAIGIAYGKAVIQGVETASTATITIPGITNDVELAYGYPSDGDQLTFIVDGLENGDFDKGTVNGVPSYSGTVPTGYAPVSSIDVFGYDGFNCIVAYLPAPSANLPAIVETHDASTTGSISSCF